MTGYAALLRESLDRHLAPALTSEGFAGRRSYWTKGDLQVRAVNDSKARDPYRGGAFTLEFEISPDGRFEWKLAGRVRVDQLLDAGQRERFLHVRNLVAARLPRPPDDWLEGESERSREIYMRAFAPAADMAKPSERWLRFRTDEDLAAWCGLLVGELPTFLERVRTLDPHVMYLAKPLEWKQP